MVFEGRDMGTRVFPDAEARFFLTASLEERAARRQREIQAQSKRITLHSVKEKMALRDQQDATRDIAPLMIPPGAVVIDTTNLTPEQVVERLLRDIPHSKRRV
jgi:cytidylate kinase